MKRPIFSSLITCIFIAASFSLSAQIYDLSGTLSGANEVPPTASPGTGTISGTYDAATGLGTIDVTYSNLSAMGVGTVSHIHDAPAGINGGVIVPLNIVGGATSGFYSTPIAIPLVNQPAFLAGDTYVNIHSTAVASGEIRGQIIATLAPAIPTLGTWSLAILAIAILIIGSVVMKYRTKLT